jgi:predicted RNA-binding protein with PUA-like domain
MPAMAGSRLLARGNRLSVLPLTDAEFEAIVAAGTSRAGR